MFSQSEIRLIEMKLSRLERRVTELEAALAPFARYASYMEDRWGQRSNSAFYGSKNKVSVNITYGDFRRAVKVMDKCHDN